MTRISKSAEAAAWTKAEMVDGIVAALDRTFPTGDTPGGLAALSSFFHALDEPTLRAIAYQHGVFEEPPRDEVEVRETREPAE